MLGVQLKYKRYYIMELQFIPNFNSLYVCQLFKIFKYTNTSEHLRFRFNPSQMYISYLAHFIKRKP